METKQVLVIHGCNLNLLGAREPEIYGHVTLDEIDSRLAILADELGLEVSFLQSNHEGEIIEAIHQAARTADAIIINPAGWTTTSIGILDAIKAVNLPAIEVHLSNIHAREDFRRHSLIAPATVGQICGFGPDSYLLALRALSSMLSSGEA